MGKYRIRRNLLLLFYKQNEKAEVISAFSFLKLA